MQTKPCPCPNCGKTLDGTINADKQKTGADTAPKPGDLSICAHCAAMLRFDDDLNLRLLTEEDMDALPVDTLIEIHHARIAVMCMLDKQKNGKKGLIEYLMDHVERVPREGAKADVVFFGVNPKNNPTIEGLRDAIRTHQGSQAKCDPLDGQEHDYIELGAWCGDQGLALDLMGLGTALGLFKIYTPTSVLGDMPPQLEEVMAGIGCISVQVMESEQEKEPDHEPQLKAV